nr:hypothetical protein [Tanacetum cinerariifolium]
MMVQAQEEMGKGSANPTDPHHTPTIIQPSISQPQKTKHHRKPRRKVTEVPQPSDLISVTDKAVNEEMNDSLERAVTTATSLDAEQDRGFEQIVDFLNVNPIKYALTVNPIVYTSCIEQFWATVKAKTVNGEGQLQALVNGKKIITTESTIRRDLQLEDAAGVDCQPNAKIFEQLTFMG